MFAGFALTAAAVCSGIAYIWAIYAGAPVLRYLFKPLTTVLILLVALTLPEPVSPLYRILIAAGILFCLAGDVFLMLPGDFFLWGLVGFLIAHLFFIAAYLEQAGGFHVHRFLLILFAIYGVILLYLLWPHVGPLRLPVLIYALVLLCMGWQAGELWWSVRSLSALLALGGALLFLVSDSILALDKFRAPIPHRDLLIMSSYYAALLLIAWSVQRFEQA
ncbi:MAG: lysoplasmalogenase [Caldilinea sp.]|nr:lysoplasmalogenase [Caldilinea sp.]MDW8442025.1 lysoplasmalogenase [Caldilineaceae bacterium]